jgi:hypothetical protein
MRKIKGFPNYILYTSGNVVNSKTGRILKQNVNKKGYRHVQLSNNGLSKTISIHKLVFENYIKEVPKGFEINHIDGNKSNNNLKNLELVTRKENMIKAVETGLIKSGEDCVNSVAVYQIDPLSNQIINLFGSINIAQKNTNIPSSSISLASRGIRKSAGGYLWKIK